MNRPQAVLAVCFMLGLASCGFAPVYGRMESGNPGVKHLLARTEISLIPNREGVYLRNNLIDRFHFFGEPANPVYKLVITPIRQTLTDLDITKSSDATRGQLRLDTTIRLVRTSDKKVVLVRELTAITSYNILASEFTNRVSEENAQQDALDELARQIETHITLYFNRIGD